MGLENLKSIFTEGIKKFEPADITTITKGASQRNLTTVDFFKSSDPAIFGFTSNLYPASKTQFSDSAIKFMDKKLNQPRYSDFIDPILGQSTYQTLYYDFRTTRPGEVPIVKNTYTGTRFEDGVGGLFHSDGDRYSISFRTINKPKGYNAETGNQIIQEGNIVTQGGGHTPKTATVGDSTVLQKFIDTSKIEKQNLVSYLPPGDGGINTDRTIVQSGIPHYNDSIFSNQEGTTNLQTTTIDVNLQDVLPKELGVSTSWSALYNSDHTTKDNVGYNYPFVNRYKLNAHPGQFIVSKIGDSGRNINAGGRFNPLQRSLTDLDRITKFMASPAGSTFMFRQNAHTTTPIPVVRIGDSLIKTPQRFSSIYNPLSTLASVGPRVLGQGVPNVLFKRTQPNGGEIVANMITGLLGPGLAYGKYTNSINDEIYQTFNNGQVGSVGGILKKIGNAVKSVIPGGDTLVSKKYGSDKLTLASMIKGDSLIFNQLGTQAKSTDITNITARTTLGNIESEKNGMPFYFKDLRDNTYVFFRAYVNGLIENLNPNWTPINYLGRSEPVYVYGHTERDISFQLKLFAHTEDELTAIYQKLNRLNSMCYPEYKKDNAGGFDGKARMKPPLLKFRLGELFGSENTEMTGFLKSINHTFDDNSPWETKSGKRVPKYIISSIAFQVVHMTTPSLDFAKKGGGKGTDFYGITHKVGVE